MLRLHLMLPPSGFDPTSPYRCQEALLQGHADKLSLEIHVRLTACSLAVPSFKGFLRRPDRNLLGVLTR